MKGSVVREEITTLILDEKEKNWLMSMVQNSKPEDSKDELELKRNLWIALGGPVPRNDEFIDHDEF